MFLFPAWPRLVCLGCVPTLENMLAPIVGYACSLCLDLLIEHVCMRVLIFFLFSPFELCVVLLSGVFSMLCTLIQSDKHPRVRFAAIEAIAQFAVDFMVRASCCLSLSWCVYSVLEFSDDADLDYVLSVVFFLLLSVCVGPYSKELLR